MAELIVPEFGEYVFTKTADGWAGPLGMDQRVDFTQCLEVIAERDATIEARGQTIAEQDREAVKFEELYHQVAGGQAGVILRQKERIAELEGQLEECDQVRFHAGPDNMTIDSGARTV